MEHFDFADPMVWGDDRLIDHYSRLQETNAIPHAEPRRTEIARELAHVAFEFDRRAVDRQKSLQPRKAIEAPRFERK